MESGNAQHVHGDTTAAMSDSASFKSVPVRYATSIRWVSAAVILISLLLLMRVLPSEQLVQWAQRWIDSWGIWGPLVLALVYIVAALLFIPGWILTVAAGAVYGLLFGTVIVSLGSTTAAALAFLIARYLARDAVRSRVEQSPKLAAVDEAIGEQGWKIVALLRVSPAVPFNLQNYLYGVTAVRFWPCILASWLAMLPGTFLYVYLGSLGRTAATGETSTAQWVMRGIGLAATIAVTVYLAKLARNAIEKRTQIQRIGSGGGRRRTARLALGHVVDRGTGGGASDSGHLGDGTA